MEKRENGFLNPLVIPHSNSLQENETKNAYLILNKICHSEFKEIFYSPFFHTLLSHLHAKFQISRSNRSKVTMTEKHYGKSLKTEKRIEKPIYF